MLKQRGKETNPRVQSEHPHTEKWQRNLQQERKNNEILEKLEDAPEYLVSFWSKHNRYALSLELNRTANMETKAATLIAILALLSLITSMMFDILHNFVYIILFLNSIGILAALFAIFPRIYDYPAPPDKKWDVFFDFEPFDLEKIYAINYREWCFIDRDVNDVKMRWIKFSITMIMISSLTLGIASLFSPFLD